MEYKTLEDKNQKTGVCARHFKGAGIVVVLQAAEKSDVNPHLRSYN
jgi:hypothetical protein